MKYISLQDQDGNEVSYGGYARMPYNSKTVMFPYCSSGSANVGYYSIYEDDKLLCTLPFAKHLTINVGDGIEFEPKLHIYIQ